jgi:hypothetical protein
MSTRLSFALLAALVLGGCAGFDPSKVTGVFNPQDYAGCTFVEHRAADGSVVNWKDCKDKSMIGATMTMPGGASFAYNADNVTGLEHMRLRAEVHRALTDAGVTVTSDAIDAIIRALRPERAP